MADYLVINGFRTTDPTLGDVIRARFTVDMTFNGSPVNKTIENVFMKVSADLKATTPPLLEGDVSTGSVEIAQNDSDGTTLVLYFTIADTASIDSNFSNQKYILQIDVLWDNQTMDRIYNQFILFNPGI